MIDIDGIPELAVEIPELSQIGLVVEDLDDGMARYSNLLGLSPWDVYTYEPPELTETTYHGEEVEFSMRVSFASAGPLIVELIEPTMGPNIYEDHLDRHGEGLHHVACFAFDDPESVVKAFEAAGMPVMQGGFCYGANFWYMDTRAELNGVIFETADRNVRDAPRPDPERVFPGESASSG